MKRRLTIKRAAELYGLSADTLRYYEKIGLIVPQREKDNGYRLYSSDDFSKLNMIASMLRMNFSLGKIKHYLEHHDLQTNISLLTQEMAEIDDAIEQLQKRRRRVQTSLGQLAAALYEAPLGQMRLTKYLERPYMLVAAALEYGEELPLLCAERAACEGCSFDLDVFCMSPAFILDSDQLEYNDARRVKRALLYADPPLGIEDGALPPGTYLSLTIKGDASSDFEAWQSMVRYLEANKLRAVGDLVEFWIINEYNSDEESEYVRLLQVLTEPVSA